MITPSVVAPTTFSPNLTRSTSGRARGVRSRFVLISDRTGGARPGVFEQGLATTDLLAPDFAIQLGDMIEGYSDDEAVITRQWDEMDALTSRLVTPLVRVPGNHDVANAVQRDVWHRRFGPTWFHFRTDDVLFCVLDTQDPPDRVADQPLSRHPGYRQVWNGVQPAALSAGQLEQWEDVLAEHRDVAWTVLCMHMPLWQGDPPAWRRLSAALASRPYTAFAGHAHNYAHTRLGGRSHVRLGPTGGMIVLDDERSEANADHVTQVTITDQGPVLANVMLSGVRDLDGRPPTLAASARRRFSGARRRARSTGR